MCWRCRWWFSRGWLRSSRRSARSESRSPYSSNTCLPIERSSESVPLNVAEGEKRKGLDRADFWRRAAGSASELTVALKIAKARKYITEAEYASVDEPLDRVRAMLWRLTH